MSKFIRLSWHRGEWDWGQMGHEMATGATGGAVTGGLAGAGVFSLEGAAAGGLLGGLFGGIGYGGSQVWYNTRSNEDKASWQAGDVQETTEQIAGWLTGFNSEKLTEQAGILKQLGDQFKQYVDSIVHNDKVDLSHNAFAQAQNPQMFSNVDMSTAKQPPKQTPKDPLVGSDDPLSPNLSASPVAPNNGNPPPYRPPAPGSQGEFSFTGSSRKPIKFVRLAVTNSTLAGDTFAMVVDVIVSHKVEAYVKQMMGKAPQAQIAQESKALAGSLTKQLSAMTPEQLDNFYNLCVQQGMPNVKKYATEIAGKSLDQINSNELAAIQKIMVQKGMTLDEAKDMFQELSKYPASDYNAVTDRMFSLRNIPSQIDPDAAANAAAGATDDVAANAAKTLIHDPTAAGVGATDLAEQTSMQMAKSMGKNMLEKGWKGLVKPGGASIIGAGVSWLTDIGLNKAEELMKGPGKMILEKSQDCLDALNEIQTLMPNKPELLKSSQQMARLFQEIMQEINEASQAVAANAGQSPQMQANPAR